MAQAGLFTAAWKEYPAELYSLTCLDLVLCHLSQTGVVRIKDMVDGLACHTSDPIRSIYWQCVSTKAYAPLHADPSTPLYVMWHDAFHLWDTHCCLNREAFGRENPTEYLPTPQHRVATRALVEQKSLALTQFSQPGLWDWAMWSIFHEQGRSPYGSKKTLGKEVADTVKALQSNLSYLMDKSEHGWETEGKDYATHYVDLCRHLQLPLSEGPLKQKLLQAKAYEIEAFEKLEPLISEFYDPYFSDPC